MKLREYILSQTSNTSGDSVDVFAEPIFGLLEGVAIVDGTLSDNFDITLSYVNSGLGTITLFVKANMSADAMYQPRELVHATADGAALTGTAGGDRALPIIAGYVTSTLADGGSVNTGSVILYVWE